MEPGTSCASREDAEDAVQDALMALVHRVGALRAAEAVTSWLFVAIRHACLRRMPEVALVPVGVAGDLTGPTPRAGLSTDGGRRGAGRPAGGVP
jgi:Sigma-70 region 2